MVKALIFWLEMINDQPRLPSNLRIEMREEYLLKREEYLKDISEEYKAHAKRDKDMIFLLTCEEFLKEEGYSGRKIERDKEEFFKLVFYAEPTAEWLVPIGGEQEEELANGEEGEGS